MNEDEKLLAFTETEVFTRQIEKLASSETLFAIQDELLQNPRKGDVIKATSGARKARIGGDGRGKRGGFRYIYVYLELNERIYLLAFYDKKEQMDLTPQQAKALGELVRQLKKNYGEIV